MSDFRELMHVLARGSEQEARQAWVDLCACPGILNRHNQRIAEDRHKFGVFQKHGMDSSEMTLMGEAWCIRMVNARRAVERGISEALSLTAYELRKQGYLTNLAHPVALPRMRPYYPARGTRTPVHP